MTLTDGSLGSLGNLGRAIGLTTASGTNSAWFGDPVGGPSNPNGLKNVLSNPDQRNALLDFVDEVLGPPQGRVDGTTRWIPLFQNADPTITVYAVVETLPGSVRVGVGVDHTTQPVGGDTQHRSVSTRLHVPLIHLPNGSTDARPSGGSDPTWLLIGHQGGTITIELDATFTDAPAVPGEAHLGGVKVQLGIPTNAADSLEFALDLVDLQLPGATSPSTQRLDVTDMAHVGSDVFEFVVGLVRAQAAALDLTQPTFRHLAGLTGILGLRPVAAIPALPLADLPQQGPAALVHWAESVLNTPAARTAWFGELARLVGGTVTVANDGVDVRLGSVDLLLGLRVTPGTGGHPVLTPWAEVTYQTRSGVSVGGGLDLLRIDTGTGAVKAIPQLKAEAVFGADAGLGTRLIPTGPAQVGSVHIGVALDDLSRPAFALTLHDVDIAAGGAPNHYDILDLSTPEAAIDALDTAIDHAISSALGGLGAHGIVGTLIEQLIGINPPGAVAHIRIVDLVGDPIAALRTYYTNLIADHNALATVLGTLEALLTASAAAPTPAPGSGTEAAPWRLTLATTGGGAGLGLAVWLADQHLCVALAADVSTPVLDQFAVHGDLRVVLLDADLGHGHLALAAQGTARFELIPRGHDPATLALGPVDLEFLGAGVEVGWRAGQGFSARIVGDGLAVALQLGAGRNAAGLMVEGTAMHIDLPLPSFAADGSITWAPDWHDIEVVLGQLLALARVPVIDTIVDLLGWNPDLSLNLSGHVGAHLSLADLIADPATAVENWAAATALDCGHLTAAMGILATVLSGGAMHAPLGLGTRELPMRAPIAGVVGAPGVYAWTDPPCPPVPTLNGGTYDLFDQIVVDPIDENGAALPVGASIIAALHRAATAVPGLDDALFARPSLAAGFDQLIARWTGTDGITGPAASLPTGVTGLDMGGFGYAELAAWARSGNDLLDELGIGTAAVVHVGCDAEFGTGYPDASRIDATGGTTGTAAPSATLDPTGNGTWYVRLPTPRVGAAGRTDHDGVAAQVAHLAEVLARRTDHVVVVGYGAAGAAAVRAANTITTIDSVVTVGTPWAPIAVTALQSGVSGNALSFLSTMAPVVSAADWPDDVRAQQSTPLVRGADMVQRSTAVSGPVDLPSADIEPRRTGLTLAAVFGVLSAADSTAALTGVLAASVYARATAAYEAALAASVAQPTDLHVGIDVPVLSTDIGGITLGAGASFELVHLARGTVTPTLTAARDLSLTLDLAVTDGWLVGGPGATNRDVEVRWLQVTVHVPLQIGGQPPGAGFTEIVLHDAKVFAAARERWVIRADGATTLADAISATTALPEVKIVLGEVMGRLHSSVPTLASLLETVGVMHAGGLDPDGLDRLLFDPSTTLRAALAAGPATLATALNTLIGNPVDPQRPATAVDLGSAECHLRVDLATHVLQGSASIAIEGMPTITLTVESGPQHTAADIALGTLDPADGGVALHLGAATGSGFTARIDHRTPADPSNAAATTSVPLLPTLDLAGLTKVLATLVPATLIHAVVSATRDAATDAGRATIDSALDALGLVRTTSADGGRAMLLPFTLLADPVAWLQRRADPLAAAVTLLDALAPIVAPNRGAQPGWPIDPAFGITYGVAAGRLQLAAQVRLTDSLDGVAVAVDVAGGIAIATDAPPQPVVDATATVDGWGLHLHAGAGINLDLVRPAPSTPIALYPAGAGLGSAIADVGVSLVPNALNALAGHRNDGDNGLAQHVGEAIYELGDALGLTEGASPTTLQFTGPRITAFAADPGGSLLSHIPALASAGLAALAHALDPTGTIVTTAALPNSRRRFAFGHTGTFHIDLDGTPGQPAIELGGTFALQGNGAPLPLGEITIERLRLAATGVQIDVRVGPVQIDLGAMVLRPIVVVRAGVADGSFSRMIGIGVGLDDHGDQSVEFRWALNATPPVLAAITRTSTAETVNTDIAEVALDLVSVAVSLASGIIAQQLHDVLTADAVQRLQGVVFTGGTATIDPTFILDLAQPEHLLHRLYTLGWNCAAVGTPLSFTIGDLVIGLTHQPDGPNTRLGLEVTLAPGKKISLAQGDVNVDLEVDGSWIDPHVDPGIDVYVLAGTGPGDLHIDFGMAIAGLGLRFTKAAGPLLDVGGIALDGIAVHLYGEASSSGVGGGVQLQLSGLAVAPGGGGGGNGMANSLVNDAGSSGQSNRPTFSPSLSIQKHPTTDVAVGLRAGDPPGPWWVVVQRQLGPIYLERIGLDTAETNGKVTRISLLFTGSVSLFGLNASVEQLSLNWNGGDVLSISSWSADLMGLAVSANMAGVSLAGGLLKSVDGGVTSYVGMLVGRFATYGLSVFGGYASDPQGHASFFVFGAVTGPIGGPPAFFLTGLGGGLGINRGLIIPDDLSKFPTYPFIMALDPAAPAPSDPMAELHDLIAYFPHKPGNFWFAAGISFTCFALVDGVAVVAVSFGDGLDIDLLGLARMALPRPQAPLVSIELALLARFSTSEGVFMIKAQLTDNSWLLYRDIRLTGGFAFAMWWKGQLKGQFVLTIGGYHPDFHHDGYPEVPRLGLVWQISDNIVMKGESYFALTSEALMAGVGVLVSVDFGWVWAKIEFGADGIVYFDPFFFDVRAYARISAGIDIDLGLFSISLSLTLGASIEVWGPDFAGKVTFTIGPCEVPIGFGSKDRKEGPTIDWPAFVAKYLEDAGGGVARAVSGITGKGTLPASTKGAQSAPPADGSPEHPFQVFAEFEISFTTTVPTTTFAIASNTTNVPAVMSNGAGAVMGLAPMGAGNLTSQLVVHLSRLTAPDTWTPVPELSRLIDGVVVGQPGAAGPRIDTDGFPTGVWGPTKALDPTRTAPASGDVIVTGNRVTLVAGVDVLTVGPPINYYQVKAGRRPLPLTALGIERSQLLQSAATVIQATPTTAAQALAVARDVLFTDSATRRGGAVSNLGRAAYVYDRVSPPRFADLTDGLAVDNGTAGDRSVLPAPTAPTAPEVRAPFVSAYFASGIGAAATAPSTTVADGRLKRRPAPRTDSVRGRLGVHIPAVLRQSAPPAIAGDRGLEAALAVPRTDVLGAVRTITSGSVGRLPFNGTVGGLTGPAPMLAPRGTRLRAAARDDASSTTLPTGDVVALQFHDAHIDTSSQRPAVKVAGKARVVMLAPHGVVFDDDAVDTSVPVPCGTKVIGVQADGDADATDGLAGWHDRSRIGLLSSRAAIGAGCAITVDGRGSSVSAGWATASRLVLNASEVHTRFSRPVHILAIALTGVPPTSLDDTAIHLVGARLARTQAGDEKPPVVVTLGQTTVLVHALVPDRGATSLTVSIAVGSDWVVSGVLGATDAAAPSPSDLGIAIARRGLAGLAAQLTVMQGPGCTVDWQPGEQPAPAPAAVPAARPARTTRTRKEQR